jgi:hypothetical protein
MKLVEVLGPKHDREEHLPSKMQTDDSKVESKMMKMRNKMKQYHVRKVIWVLGLMVLLYTLLFCRLVTSDGQPMDALHAKLFNCAQSIVIFVVYLLG